MKCSDRRLSKAFSIATSYQHTCPVLSTNDYSIRFCSTCVCSFFCFAEKRHQSENIQDEYQILADSSNFRRAFCRFLLEFHKICEWFRWLQRVIVFSHILFCRKFQTFCRDYEKSCRSSLTIPRKVNQQFIWWWINYSCHLSPERFLDPSSQVSPEKLGTVFIHIYPVTYLRVSASL